MPSHRTCVLGLSALVNVSLVVILCSLAFSRTDLASPVVSTKTRMAGFRPLHVQRSARQFRNMRVYDGEGASEVSPVVSEIVEKLKTMSLLEASQLVKEIEETFGVDASAAGGGVMMMAGGAPGAAGGAAEEEAAKDAFDVVLDGVDDSKRVAALKAIRGLTGVGLKEAKEFISGFPKAVKEGISKEDAEAAVKDLEAAGLKVSIK
eukprot:CAMPEP_0114499720 /NCGR_PEP_ID=MMETSP0109-20121206/7573_1 /TAXON_ID=29199 /ORGANISM="Chlorarachnion reptans, Strain CCCM449" /LENGTH=205 /DNA_ID=CAMNT_0001677317 /DNA_START=61 /DNA_END=678 /DNA_ORIENTATION=+